MTQYRTGGKIRSLIEKSRDAALLAVEVYNKPRTTFRSAGYVVLMHVAWTSLFHAIFEKNKIKYFYKKPNKVHYEKVDGEYKAWELSECLKKFYKGENLPEVRNLEFFIKLRNKIEHRFAPQLDHDIFGECQALLLNYENLLVKEFGEKFAINENLVFSLQFSHILHPSQFQAKKKLQTRDYKNLKNFVETYRGELDNGILDSMNYSFRVFLLPKVGGHRSSSDFTIEFVKYDLKNKSEKEKYRKFLVAIKEKRMPIEGLTPSTVASKVYKALKDKMPSGWKFNASSHHARCWRYYKVRPEAASKNPEKTKRQYCFFEPTFKQYGYTNDWANFLINELSDDKKYKEVMKLK